MVNTVVGKTALIIHGGALKSAYAAGLLSQLGKRGIKHFDYVAGTSASVGTAAYYASGQYEEIRKIWIERIGGSRDFVSMWRWLSGKPMFDVPYLLHIFEHVLPLNVNALLTSPSEYLVPMYNLTKKRHEYYSSRDSDAREHLLKALQIGMTVHKDHVVLRDGSSYADTEIEPLAIYCDPHFSDVTHALVLTNHTTLAFDLWKTAGTWIFRNIHASKFPHGSHDLLRNRSILSQRGRTCLENFCIQHHVLIHNPSKNVGIKPWTLVANSRQNMERLVTAGIRAADSILADHTQKDFVSAIKERSDYLGMRKLT